MRSINQRLSLVVELRVSASFSNTRWRQRTAKLQPPNLTVLEQHFCSGMQSAGWISNLTNCMARNYVSITYRKTQDNLWRELWNGARIVNTLRLVNHTFVLFSLRFASWLASLVNGHDRIGMLSERLSFPLFLSLTCCLSPPAGTCVARSRPLQLCSLSTLDPPRRAGSRCSTPDGPSPPEHTPYCIYLFRFVQKKFLYC